MTKAQAKSTQTEVSSLIRATRSAIYRACLDPKELARWRVPDGMTAEVHEFEARQGGGFRMSLTYLDPGQSPGGKTTADTDTFQGRFVELVPDRKIVEAIKFESADRRFAGEMKMTTRLVEAGAGTEVTVICEDIPAGIRLEDNEQGCREALKKLAALLE